MSAPQVSKPNGKGALPQGGAPEEVIEGVAKQQPKSDHERNMRLMGEMGAPSYNPMPPSQHNCWRGIPDASPLIRMWSLMTHLTLDFGHRTPYASYRDEHGALHAILIEQLAERLSMDEANTYRTWREGLDLGLWRNGTKEEGKRKLFLCGSVKPKAQPKGSEQEDENSPYRQFPPYLRAKIKALPAERQRAFLARYEFTRARGKAFHAELTAAVRLIEDQEHDTTFEEYGLPKRRETHVNRKATPEDQEARALRIATLREQLLSVQTIWTLYEPTAAGLHKPEGGSRTDNLSLLSRQVPEKGQSREAGRDSDVVSQPSAKNSHEEVKHAEYLHAGELPALQTQEEREAEGLLFDEIGRYQKAYKREDFGSEPIAKNNKSHQLLVRRMLWAVRPDHALDFCFQVVAKFKGLDRNALGKLQPRSPAHPNGPRSIALLLDWAMDYHKKLDPDPYCDRNLAELIMAAGPESTWVNEKDRDWARALLNRKGRTNGGAQ